MIDQKLCTFALFARYIWSISEAKKLNDFTS